MQAAAKVHLSASTEEEPGSAGHSTLLDWHQIAVEMMLTDAELALQSVACLLATDDQRAVARIAHNARETYDSLRERRRTVSLAPREASHLDDDLAQLRTRLELLGEPL